MWDRMIPASKKDFFLRSGYNLKGLKNCLELEATHLVKVSDNTSKCKKRPIICD